MVIESALTRMQIHLRLFREERPATGQSWVTTKAVKHQCILKNCGSILGMVKKIMEN
jgi:hypothetical protein